MLSFTFIVFSVLMSNSNYSIGLQRLKPVHTAYCSLHNLAENWSWARDVNGRDRDVDNFSRDETETRPRPQPCRKETILPTCVTTHTLTILNYYNGRGTVFIIAYTLLLIDRAIRRNWVMLDSLVEKYRMTQ